MSAIDVFEPSRTEAVSPEVPSPPHAETGGFSSVQQAAAVESAGNGASHLPVPVDNLCLALSNKGKPCRTPRMEGSDYCYRHQPRELPAGAAPQRAPFPTLPPEEELSSPEGVRRLITALLAYIAEHEDADLPRVYAMQAYTGALLRAVDVAQLQARLEEALRDVAQLKAAREELSHALQGERSRRKTPTEEEVEFLRASTTRLARRNEELEAREDTRLELLERLEATVADQHQERQIAERTLAETLERLRKVHRTLCYPCAMLVRPVIGGEPELGDPDFVERSEYLGGSCWRG